MLPTRRPNVVTRVIEGETVILDRVAGKVHQLNAAASCIWSHCDGVSSTNEIAVRLAASFKITQERALADVERVLGELQQLELLLTGQDEAEQLDKTGGQHER
jgi:hypothetical protein